jgi:hypothetical protein
MYGDDGWCRGCGVPSRTQCGSLVLQASKLPKGPLWMPNWRFDALCARVPETSAVLERFAVRTLPVHTPRSRDTGIVQILATTTAAPWYDEADLWKAAVVRHGDAGRRCTACGTWRWFPLPSEHLPPAQADASWADQPVVASPEWFGDGFKVFRELLFRRDLAEALAALHPRVWSLDKVAPGPAR